MKLMNLSFEKLEPRIAPGGLTVPSLPVSTGGITPSGGEAGGDEEGGSESGSGKIGRAHV